MAETKVKRKGMEFHSGHRSKAEAIDVCDSLNKNQPSDRIEWVVKQTIPNVRWAVVRFGMYE